MLANLLILTTKSSLYTITTIVCYHKFLHLLILIFLIFWLFMLDLPRGPTHATPDNIPVLATHSSWVTIDTITSFTLLASFPTFVNQII